MQTSSCSAQLGRRVLSYCQSHRTSDFISQIACSIFCLESRNQLICNKLVSRSFGSEVEEDISTSSTTSANDSSKTFLPIVYHQPGNDRDLEEFSSTEALNSARKLRVRLSPDHGNKYHYKLSGDIEKEAEQFFEKFPLDNRNAQVFKKLVGNLTKDGNITRAHRIMLDAMHILQKQLAKGQLDDVKA